MPYEDAASIGTLNPLWPLGGDPKSEGDDHIRMLKRVLQSAGIASAESKNRIVNAAMQISQENGNTAGSAGGWYAADQWVYGVVSTGVASFHRIQQVTPKGSRDRIRVIVNTADTSIAAGELAEIATKLEGVRVADFLWGTPNARQVVLRFGWRSTAGTYCVSLVLPGAGNRNYLIPFTIAPGQAGTDTEQTFVIPGDTAGIWPTDSSVALQIGFTVMAGATHQGAGNVWQAGSLRATAGISNGFAAVGNEFQLFDVGLYVDADKTGLAPKWVAPDYAQELATCQRYFQNLLYSQFSGNVTAGISYTSQGAMVGPMRVAPTLSGLNHNNSSFPATVGTLTQLGNSLRDARAANATANSGLFITNMTATARM